MDQKTTLSTTPRKIVNFEQFRAKHRDIFAELGMWEVKMIARHQKHMESASVAPGGAGAGFASEEKFSICPSSQEKFHTGVLWGVRNISHAP